MKPIWLGTYEQRVAASLVLMLGGLQIVSTKERYLQPHLHAENLLDDSVNVGSDLYASGNGTSTAVATKFRIPVSHG